MTRFAWPWRAARPPAAPAEPQRAVTYAGPQALTLQDLVLLHVSVSWQEAVAVVSECLHSLPDRRAFPDTARVALTEIGEVRPIGAAGLPGHPVRTAAQYLRELLGTTLAPPELRSTIEQCLNPAPRYATLDEFATALTYFERPGRRGDVAAVYGRGHTLYVKALADLELERLRARAVHEKVALSFGLAPPVITWQQRALNVALVLVLLLVIGLGGTALFSMAFAPLPARTENGQPVAFQSPLDTTAAASAEARRVIETGVGKATEVVGTVMTRLPGNTTTPPTPADVAAHEAPRRPHRSEGRSAGPSATFAAPLPPTAPPMTTPPPMSAGIAPPVPGSPAIPAVPAAVDVNRRPAVPDVEWTVSVRDVTAAMVGQGAGDGTLISTDGRSPAAEASTVLGEAIDALPAFTGADSNIVPATLIRPQLPSRINGASGSGGGVMSTLDLVIDEFGRVERVRLESGRNSLNEKMLLSAAKAWVFQPAMRGGRPVRYRLRVQLSD